MAEQLIRRSKVLRRTQIGRLCTCLVLLVGVLDLAAHTTPAAAQTERCFEREAPAISACISGRFQEFWETNGGLATFGYPLTRSDLITTPEGTFVTQVFERARFELHPENERPYDVLLGRLGAELLARQGRAGTERAPETPADGCQYWQETQHNVCGPFLDAWRGTGLQLDGDAERTDAERLALWGLPLTGVEPLTSASGVVLVQWFERARIEQQPDGSITVGRLGSESAQSAPVPAPTTPPPPEQATAVPTAPTTAPAPSVPFPQAPCNVRVPPPAEGLQLWMADAAPARARDAVACVRLIVGGEAARGANAITYRYYGGERRPSIPQSTGSDGVASFIFYIGEEPSGTRIPVEAVVTLRGITYVAYSEFVPQ